MPQQIIKMQERFLLSLSATNPSTYSMPEWAAANVLPGALVTPFVKIYTSADNFLNTSTGALTFNFSTAALLLTADESASTGPRFVPLGPAASIAPAAGTMYNGAANAGQTLTFPPLTSPLAGLPAIQNPGGLLLWSATNTTTVLVRLWVDIYLVCRGP